MNRKRYHIITFLRALIVTPVVVSIGAVCLIYVAAPGGRLGLIIGLGILSLLFGYMWYSYAKKPTLPESVFEAVLPVVAVFCYYMLVWVIIFGLSHYQPLDGVFGKTYLWATAPYFIVNIILIFLGTHLSFPALQVVVLMVTLGAFWLSFFVNKKQIKFGKLALICFIPILCFSAIATYQAYDRSLIILTADRKTEHIKDEINPSDYKPFSGSAKLQTLPDALLAIDHAYPKIDGATAAYPVYSSIVQSIYKEIDSKTVADYVFCSNTDNAYERLINGKIDIFFGAQPSRQQQELSKEKGVELKLTPIAREAFVFFVHKNNPVNSLTLAQIQAIYLKEIVNWKELGGNNERIMPFQRPENSGSQTIMLAKVMNGKELSPPLREEYASGMGGVINQVASYRNYSSAIGYSFRYYTTGMNPNNNIKILSINGINPTVENIKNGDYPFTIDVYAVTAGTTNQHVEPLINWILSEQGQTLIEECGYVRHVQK